FCLLCFHLLYLSSLLRSWLTSLWSKSGTCTQIPPTSLIPQSCYGNASFFALFLFLLFLSPLSPLLLLRLRLRLLLFHKNVRCHYFEKDHEAKCRDVMALSKLSAVSSFSFFPRVSFCYWKKKEEKEKERPKR